MRTNENAFTKLMLNRNSSPVLTLATGRVSLGTRFFKKPGNFRVAPSLSQSEAKWEAIDVKMIFHSFANDTHLTSSRK